MLKGELEASETTETDPLAEPELNGAKIAVKVTLWFGLSVIGKVKPLVEKAVPLALAFEIVTGELPELVSVSDNLVLPPT